MPGGVALSPDARTVVFVEEWLDGPGNQVCSNLYAVPADGSATARQITFGPRRDLSPQWCPDGTRLAFLSNRETPWRLDLYVLDLAGGEARLAAKLPRGIQQFAWSPDGSRFALSGRGPYPEDPDLPPATDDEERRRRYLDRARYVSKLKYRLDGIGHFDDEPMQIWVADAFTGSQPTALTTDFDATQPRWMPDGRIAFLMNRERDEDRTWRDDVWAVSPGGGEPELVHRGAGPIAFWGYSFSPDGRLAVIGLPVAELPAGNRNPRVYVDGVDITAHLDRPAGKDVLTDTLGFAPALQPQWLGEDAFVQVCDEGSVGVRRLVDGAEIDAVVNGRRAVGDFSAARDTVAFTSTSTDDPCSVRIARVGEPGEQVLHDPNPWLAERDCGEVVDLSFELDGMPVSGWAALPPGDRARTPGATILEIHGGPHAAYGHGWGFHNRLLAAQGYRVIYCNPPGSTGYGEAFAQPEGWKWGEYDLPYFMAFIDEAVRRGIADPERLGVTGASYGGYATIWLISHTQRFKAAVASRPTTSIRSFVGASDVGWAFSKDLFGVEPWDDQSALDVQSPVTYVKDIHTPLRLIACTNDMRTPPEQSEQVYVRLRKLGRECDLVLLPGESHGITFVGRPLSRVRHQRALVEWFQKHLPA